MTEGTFGIGDLVTITSGALEGQVGVVSRPTSGDDPGHVILVVGEGLIGAPIRAGEVRSAEEGDQGFAQLAYNLNVLSSKVMEQRLVVYGPDR